MGGLDLFEIDDQPQSIVGCTVPEAPLDPLGGFPGSVMLRAFSVPAGDVQA